MAFEEPLHSMYDLRLKPRLLSSIMATHLPDDRQPPKSPAELSTAVSMIRRHHLLFEPSANESAMHPSGRLVDPYKVAVDAWIERISVLISSTSTEKSWSGVCLFGVTCQECTRQRFLESYAAWFQKLTMHLKPTDPLFVRGAACASLTDLLVRLGALIEITGVRRDGTGLSSKLTQPVLQLLAEEGSKSIWNDGIDLLSTMLKFFPASLKQQSSQVEAVLVGKLLEVEMNTSLSQKFARCLALLPKAHGDAATWNLLLRRILLAINAHLDEAFSGMEDGALAKEVVAALMPRGQEQNWFLGGISVAATTMNDRAKKFWQLLVPRVSVLMKCCDYLMINAYPVQVPVPLSALLALITRILSVDGSPYRSASVLGAPVSSVQQATLCCELPALHSCALDLLYATISGVRSQLLPRAADIVRLLTEYFQRCGSPNLRIKLYNISKQLLIALGIGMASAFAPALIENSMSDLKAAIDACSLYPSNVVNNPAWVHGVSGWPQSTNPRKRKDPSGMHVDLPAAAAAAPALDVGADNNDVTSTLAVQIGALEAIEALLTVGGSLRSDHWRTEVDSVVANVALIASAGALSPAIILDDTSCKGQSRTFSLGSFQLAAYKAFLASILSPCSHRPPFLSQALMVFRKARQEAAGTEVAEFCAHALLALEPLIHPRALPCLSSTLAQQASTTAGRGSVSENFVAQTQRANLPLQQPVTAGISTASVTHGYSSQLPAPSLKVGETGMHLEVEGDPYVQEDIESWIIDYGGAEQGILNDNSSMMIEAFQGELQAINDTARDIMTDQVSNVCARQSLANDEDGVMLSIGDIIPETREVSRNLSAELMGRRNFEMDDANEMPGLFATSSEKIELSEREVVESSQAAVPCPVSTLRVSEVNNPVEQESSTTLMQTVETTTAPIVQDTTGKQQGEYAPGLSDLAFSSMDASTAPESDSDAIPDIVDGDPDTECE